MGQIKFISRRKQISLLKKNIIRLDFESLTDINIVVKQFKRQTFISNNLKGYSIIKSIKINFQMLPSVFEDKYIPVEPYDVTDMHRFFDSTIQPLQD